MVTIAVLISILVRGTSVTLEDPQPCGCSDDVLQYDDGTACWLTWGGMYRGVWFHLEDFSPGCGDFLADTLEYWFYHSGSWDTCSFYAELYSGGSGGPEIELFSTSVTAGHYCPTYVEVSPPVQTGGDFWIIVDTEMSSGGWPSLLGDGTPNSQFGSHSFLSDDFMIWEPWIIQGPEADDYMIRAHGIPILGLEEETWGAIKGLFGSR